MTAKVDLEVVGGTAIIRFSNPDNGYMTDDTSAGLLEALDRIESDDVIRAAILTGADDGVFIRHFDVKVLEERGRALAARGLTFTEDRPVPPSPLHDALKRMETCPKPLIAALNGVTMGGGFEIALGCDIRLAEAGDYRIGLPEANIGLLPGAGGTQRLPRLIGEARALEFMLTGCTVTPELAEHYGLVSACVDAPVLDHAKEMARALCAKPANALAHIKRLVRLGADDDMLAAERTLFCDLMVSDEGIELMARMNAGGDILNPRGDA